MYSAERADHQALEQLEVVLREVAEELATWRARALKAEADAKRAGVARGENEPRGRAPEPDGENRQLRARLEAARVRVEALVTRLAFLEEQSRETAGTGETASGGGVR